MRRIPGAFLIGILLIAQVPTVGALGFGRVSNSTTLGQQLDFAVSLTTEAGESVAPDCVSAEVYAGDNQIAPGLVRTRVDTPADGGASTLRVVTNVRIEEPVASVNISVGCPPRLTRKFVVFVDPPVMVAPPTVAGAGDDAMTAPVLPRSAVTSTPLPPSRRAKPTVGPPRAVASRAPRDESAVARVRPKRNPSLTAIEPQRVPLTRRAAVTAGTMVATTAGAPRLKLEAELPAFRPAATASAPSAADRDVAGASAPGTGGLIADAELLRMQLLEQNIQKLLSEAKATQASLAAMQARLREAEAQRYSNPLIYALLGLVGLLLAAVLLLLWRQSRMKRESAWWAAGSDAQAAAAAAAAAAPAEAASPAVEPAAAADVPAASPLRLGERSQALPAVPLDQLRGQGQAPQNFVVDGMPGAGPREFSHSISGEAERDMSVEELIDMEQQAEFFIVLGQDDAAIDLLMGHVRSGGSSSPLAYLKLLEIYRRREEREPYERMRERFNRRFNAYAPDWEAGAGSAQVLEDYPEVVARIQSVWPDPPAAMKLLESLLFRRDASASTFDLPAYGELLFLYSQARDLADSGEGEGEVDLLLPLGEDFDLSDAPRPTELSRLDGRAAPAAGTGPVDFSVDFDTPSRRG